MSALIHISDTDLSDFFKDAYGFRPRSHYKEWWTQHELDAEYHHLSEVCRENRIREEAAEAQALIDFNKLIDETISFGASDRETAIRWLVDGENLTLTEYDLEYFFWGHGLSYELQKSMAKEYAHA
jgi:hypothetical protein